VGEHGKSLGDARRNERAGFRGCVAKPTKTAFAGFPLEAGIRRDGAESVTLARKASGVTRFESPFPPFLGGTFFFFFLGNPRQKKKGFFFLGGGGGKGGKKNLGPQTPPNPLTQFSSGVLDARVAYQNQKRRNAVLRFWLNTPHTDATEHRSGLLLGFFAFGGFLRLTSAAKLFSASICFGCFLPAGLTTSRAINLSVGVSGNGNGVEK